MDDFGLTFSPTASNDARGQANGAASDNVQEAIRTLSLRLPKFGGQGLSPLMGMGSNVTGTPQMGLEQLLARLFGQSSPQSNGPLRVPFGSGQTSQPAPNVLPGVDNVGGNKQPTPSVILGQTPPDTSAPPAPIAPANNAPPKFEQPRQNYF